MLQIIGTRKCAETRKALRFCKERSIEHQFVDLNERRLSDGEWKKIFQALDPHALIDDTSSYYVKQGYAWREYNSQEELQLHPELLKTPILKSKSTIRSGFDTDYLETHRVHA